MAGPAEIQYYDAKFVSDETNMVYHNIINCEPTKPPYFNNSFRTLFSQGPSEIGDKKQFFVRKRSGFTKLKRFHNGVEETDNDWRFSDMKVRDGYRYFFAIKKDYTKCRIYKQDNINDLSPCDNSCLNDITDGQIVRLFEFDYGKCYHNKLLQTTGVKGNAKYSSTTGTIRVQRIADTLFSSIYDNQPISADGGDYIFVYGNESPVDGYMVQVGGQAANLPFDGTGVNVNSVYIDGQWLPGLAITGDITQRSDIYFKVFTKYGLVLSFVTADGIVILHSDTEYTIIGGTKKNITSYCQYSDKTAFLDNDTGILWMSDYGYNKFHFSATQSYPTHGLYTNIVERQGVLLLLGPENIGYFLYDEQTQTGLLTEATERNGFYSKDSWCLFDEKFFIIRKTQDFYNLQLQFGFGRSRPLVMFTYMNNYLNTDLGMLVRGTDNVNLVVDDNQTNIFMHDGTGNTKLLIFNRYYNLRHKRYIRADITSVVDGIYLGDGIYKYEGITDNGNDIDQIVTMVWGDMGHTAIKKIQFIKLPIGYGSYIEKGKTQCVCSSDNGGWHYDRVYNDLGRTEYVDDIMRLQINPTINNNALDTIRTYPTDVYINSAKGVNYNKDIGQMREEFDQYINYNYPDGDTGEDVTTFNVSKFGTIKIPVGLTGEVFTFDLIAKGTNRLEFGGYFIGYEVPDVDYTRIENVATFGDLTIDSGKTK